MRPDQLRPLLALLALLAAPSAVATGGGGQLHVRLCFGLTIHKQNKAGQLTVNRSFAVPEAAATIRALDDIESRDCTILGPGCERLLALPGGNFTSLTPYVMDLRTLSHESGALALLTCERLRGDALLGLYKSEQNDAAALLAHSFGTPVMSHSASSPHLSNKARFGYFSRSCFSSEIYAKMMVVLYKRLGWLRVGLMYENTIKGFDYNEIFLKYARAAGIEVYDYGVVPSLGLKFPLDQIYNASDPDGEEVRAGFRRALRFMDNNDIKVVHTTFNYGAFFFFANTILDSGWDLSQYHWSSPNLPMIEDLVESMNNQQDRVVRNQTLDYPGMLHGLFNIQHGLAGEMLHREAKLAAHLRGFKVEQLSRVLRDPGGVPDPFLAPTVQGTLDGFLERNLISRGALNAYDSVWAMAAAFTRAALQEAQARPVPAGDNYPVPKGEAVIHALHDVAFDGASGPIQFDASADRATGHNHNMDITNLVWDEAAQAYGYQVVGRMTAREDGEVTIELFTGGAALVWPDGTRYPEIPSDGSVSPPRASSGPSPTPSLGSGFPWYAILAVALLLIVVAVAVAGFSYWHQRLVGSPQRWRGPPLSGQPVTFAITDIQGSTTLWDRFPEEKATDIACHHEAARARLAQFHGYEIATEGDSFKCAFHRPEDAVLWSVCLQLDLLCAPWTSTLEDGGQGIFHGEAAWADCERPVLLDAHHQTIVNMLATRDSLTRSTRAAAGDGHVQPPMFDPAAAAGTRFSSTWAARHGHGLCCFHSQSPGPLPLFRGLRVRVGIHSGVAEQVSSHENTRRLVYGGEAMRVAKAVSDAPCGGQIIASGEAIAAVQSMPALSALVASACAGWRSGLAAGNPTAPVGVSIMHLGSHIVLDTESLQPYHSANEESFSTDRPSQSSTASFATLRSETLPAAGTAMLVSYKEPDGTSSFSNLEALRGGSAPEPTSLSAILAALPALKPLRLPEEGAATETPSDEAQPEGLQELVMVAPWPLIQRAMYFPPPSTRRQVTPAWSGAPRADSVTILFTNLEKHGKLLSWERERGDGTLQRAVQTAQRVIRSELAACRGYEVEGEGANFVCAFHSSMDAVRFAMGVQVGLVMARWDPDVLASPWGCEYCNAKGEITFRGLRVAMGMCTGKAMRVQPSDRTGRMEYFGPIMNHAARVAMVAHGGQVLMHETAIRQACSLGLLPSEDTVLLSLGPHSLKGIANKVEIFQVTPKALATRDFAPLRVNAPSSPNWKVVNNGGSGQTGQGTAANDSVIETYLQRFDPAEKHIDVSHDAKPTARRKKPPRASKSTPALMHSADASWANWE